MGKRGKLFVISAPSGSGKTTLCEKLIRAFSGKRKLLRSVSATTRRMRKGEREGRDYFFISRGEFSKKRRAGQFLEWAKVLGNFYGTPRAPVEKHTNRGDDVLLSIDVQGAMKVKRKAPGAIFIFILPPTFEELERRLRRRSTENRAEILRRLRLAKREMGFVKKYNYLVVNDKVSRAVARLKQIIQKERER